MRFIITQDEALLVAFTDQAFQIFASHRAVVTPHGIEQHFDFDPTIRIERYADSLRLMPKHQAQELALTDIFLLIGS